MAKKRKNPIQANSLSQNPSEINENLVDTNRDDDEVTISSEFTEDDENFTQAENALNRFRQQIRAGFSNTEQDFTIHTIERMLGGIKSKLLKAADDSLLIELNNVDEQKLIKDKKKEYKKQGVILRTNAKATKKIISQYGIIPISRYILNPKDEENKSKLLLLTSQVTTG